ncbi:AAA+ ATPase domain-containing protein [Tumidithrix helvetica PCC 7403]|uniref:ATP-binding protein n=1 Tax=Tumidithrix helvetica TaxID=3457545 RepID=UPI003C87F9FA
MVLSTVSTYDNWHAINHAYLIAALASIRSILEQRIERFSDNSNGTAHIGSEFQSDIYTPSLDGAQKQPLSSAQFNHAPFALDRLCQALDLSPFDRDVLLLCVGMEFDSGWATLCAKASGDSQRTYPTLGLALSISSTPDWVALSPKAPLRRWRLIDIGVGNALTTSPLRIDERILHFLAGVHYLDERLAGIVEPLQFLHSLVPSHHQIVQQMSATWAELSSGTVLPVLQLCGDDVSSKRAIAAMASQQTGLKVHALSAEMIPSDLNQFQLLKCLCEREYTLNDTALLVDCDQVENLDPHRDVAIARLVEVIDCPVIITSRDRRRQRQRPIVTFDVHPPTSDEQHIIWQDALTGTNIVEVEHLQTHIETLVSYFSLSAPAIQTICLKAKGVNTEIVAQANLEHTHGQVDKSNHQPKFQKSLWDACRSQARPRLDELAQRIDSAAGWDDLILPEKERMVLQDIAAHVRQRLKVYEDWGFAGRGKRGLGITSMFAGGSGTGKTMAAEVLGMELKLDVYRIDLSSVISKYIGETEKNLRRLFDAAEGGGVILLFDEADALFGKRSEVKDSHDRHANIEVSYLLQRMEAYRGLAVLTTNLKSSLDQAFLRRLRFVVQFPFPDAKQRLEIWQRVFPKQTPTEGLDFQKLAKLNVAGGNIRNIALNAAFIAADASEPVQMKHILQAAKIEYIKLEKPMTDVEVKGWV